MLEAKMLTKHYQSGKTCLVAVDRISLKLENGKSYVLVGESGSGKSTLSLMLMGLLPPTSGEVLLDGESLLTQRKKRNRSHFARMQMVLQDGKSALDPYFTVYDSIAEPLRNLAPLPRAEEENLVMSLIEQVQLPTSIRNRRAHELSGGQQKRVCIARALSVSPEILIFDEAVSGLDVIVRKHILDLLKSLHSEQGFTCLFITHDMDVALYIADEILVMKDGSIIEHVENCADLSVFQHPYSKLLLNAMLPDDPDEANFLSYIAASGREYSQHKI